MPDKMLEKPKCSECDHMKLGRAARRTAANRYSGGVRSECHCSHPDAEENFRATCPRSPRTPGFIDFTPPGGYAPAIKTSPRWCPLGTAGMLGGG